MKIAVLDDYQGVAPDLADWNGLGGEVTFFRDTIDGPGLVERLKPFDVVCLMRERTPMHAALIRALPNLKLIVTSGPRNLSIDLAAADAQGIVVSGTEGRAPATAQLAMALILLASRGLVAEALSMRNGGWQAGLGRDLDGLTLGLIGLGKQGAQMAALARPFGMHIAAWSANLTRERCDSLDVERAESLAALLAMSDVASVHVVLSERSRGLIDAAAIAGMKRDALLVNTSRGPIVDQMAAIEALKAGQLGAAAFDVFDNEPLPADSALRDTALIDSGRLILTPHVGYVSRQTMEIFYRQTVDAIAAWKAGAPIRLLKP